MMKSTVFFNALAAWWFWRTCHALTFSWMTSSSTAHLTLARREKGRVSRPLRTTRLQEQSMNEEMDSASTPEDQQDNWLEKFALEGAAKIAKLDMHERTQRAMLAEMVENKIYENTISLEKLVDEKTGEITDMDAAKEIAAQTQSLKKQYEALVKGEESSMLKAIASLSSEGSQQ